MNKNIRKSLYRSFSDTSVNFSLDNEATSGEADVVVGPNRRLVPTPQNLKQSKTRTLLV